MRLVFSRALRVYYEDTDAGGIVYYANYLKFFERARSDWLLSLGLKQTVLRTELGLQFVVHQAHLTCHRPAVLEDELEISVHLKESRRASLVLHQQATRPSDGSLIAEATVRIACIDSSLLKPRPLPKTLLDELPH
jgi:acyl-CoA thioester hydrolase